MCRLREMREQSDQDHQEELDLYIKTNQDLKTQMEAMHFELTAKQVGAYFFSFFKFNFFMDTCSVPHLKMCFTLVTI